MERAEREREDKDYKTHLARISSAELGFVKTENLQKVHSGNKLLTGESRESREQRERTRIIKHTLPESHLLGKGCAIN